MKTPRAPNGPNYHVIIEEPARDDSHGFFQEYDADDWEELSDVVRDTLADAFYLHGPEQCEKREVLTRTVMSALNRKNGGTTAASNPHEDPVPASVTVTVWTVYENTPANPEDAT